jgi:hypothetical protein
MKYLSISIALCLSSISTNSLPDHAAASKANDRSLQSCCGANCLYVVLRIKGSDIPLGRILSHPIVSKKSPNLSLLDFKQVAADFSHKMDPVWIPADKLVSLRFPFVALIARNPTQVAAGHFVVGWAKSSSEAEIVDYPRRQPVSWEKFRAHFTGYALIDASEKVPRDLEQDANGKRTGIRVNNDSCQLASQWATSNEGDSDSAKLTWLGENNVNAGTLFEGENSNVDYEFRFQNTGKKTLVIKDPVSSCSCAEAKLSAHSIQPGQYAKLAVKLDKKTEGKFAEFVRLKTNDPSRPITYVTIKGNFVPLVSVAVAPPSCDFGVVRKDQKYTKSVTIFNPLNNPRQQKLQIKTIETNSADYITAYVNEPWNTDSNSLFKGVRTCQLRVELQHNLSPGTYTEQIALRCEPKDILIRVSFTVEPPVVCQPSICFLQLGTDSKSTPKTITFESDEENGFTICEVSTDVQWLKCLLEKNSSEFLGTHLLRVLVEEDVTEDIGGFANANIRVGGFVNDGAWEQIIPVVCMSLE